MTYDADADAAYIYVSDSIAPGEAVTQRVVDDTPEAEVILDFDKDDRLLGIELLGARRLLRSESLPPDEG